MTEPLNDRIGELFFYGVLDGAIPNPPQVYLEVKDKKGNPVEIKLKKKRPEIVYEMSASERLGKTYIQNAVRYKVGKVWLTLCYVSEDGYVTWLDDSEDKIKEGGL